MKKKFKLEDLDCANCAAKMEDAIKKIPGVNDAVVSFMTQKMTIDAEDERFEEIMDEKFDIEAIEKDFNIEKEQPVFLYCDTGSTSMLAAKKLDSVGIHAYSVVGGIMFYKGYLEKEKNDLWTMVRTS